VFSTGMDQGVFYRNGLSNCTNTISIVSFTTWRGCKHRQ